MGFEGSFREPQTTNIEEEKKPDVIKVGDTVEVLRSSGDREKDWSLSGFDQNTGDAMVTRKEGEQVFTKTIPQIELYALNKAEGGTKQFSLKEWTGLWNDTEVSHARIGFRKDEETNMLTPEEARKILREREKRNFGENRLYTQGEEAVRRLQRRIALFGGTDFEKKLLDSNQNPK